MSECMCVLHQNMDIWCVYIYIYLYLYIIYMSQYASIINQTPKRHACLRPLWEAVPIDEVDFEMLEEAAQVGVS